MSTGLAFMTQQWLLIAADSAATSPRGGQQKACKIGITNNIVMTFAGEAVTAPFSMRLLIGTAADKARDAVTAMGILRQELRTRLPDYVAFVRKNAPAHFDDWTKRQVPLVHVIYGSATNREVQGIVCAFLVRDNGTVDEVCDGGVATPGKIDRFMIGRTRQISASGVRDISRNPVGMIRELVTLEVDEATRTGHLDVAAPITIVRVDRDRGVMIEDPGVCQYATHA